MRPTWDRPGSDPMADINDFVALARERGIVRQQAHVWLAPRAYAAFVARYGEHPDVRLLDTSDLNAEPPSDSGNETP